MMNLKSHSCLMKRHSLIVASLLILFFVSQGSAGVCTSSDAIQIDVVSGSMSASVLVKPSDTGLDWTEVFDNPETKYVWQLPDNLDFDIIDESGTGTVLAHVHQLSLAVQGDPVMDFGFSITSYVDGAEFSLSSPLLTFGQINDPTEVEAYSEVSALGTTLTGNFDGKVYRAVYNNNIFAELVSGPVAIPNPIINEGTGVLSIAGGVTSMQGIYSFSLSGGILAANAISTYSITPEPATLALLALGGLVIRRRKA